MAERAMILNALQAKRAELETTRPTLEAEFERIAKRKRDLDDAIEALDVVIRQFGGTVSSTETPQRVSAKNENQDDAHIGLKALARRYVNELPTQFTKNDVEALIHERREGMVKLNPNTLAGVLRDLCDRGLARIKIPSVGRSPQVYERSV